MLRYRWCEARHSCRRPGGILEATPFCKASEHGQNKWILRLDGGPSHAAGHFIAIGLAFSVNLGTAAVAQESAAAAATVRDKLWIFTAPAGGDNDALKQAHFPRLSRMTPAEGAFYLNVPNLMIVSYQGKPEPPFDQDAIPFRPLKQVVWCLNGTNGKILERQQRQVLFDFARGTPNLTGFLLDDFFNEIFPVASPNHVTLDQLRQLRKEAVIGGKRQGFYVVVYQHQLDLPIKPYLDLCDKVTYWTWQAKDLTHLERDFQRLEKLAPDRPKLLGCYFWDFGGLRPTPLDLMQKQCRLGLPWLREGPGSRASSSWPIRWAIWTCRPSSGRGSGLPRWAASRSAPSDNEPSPPEPRSFRP